MGQAIRGKKPGETVTMRMSTGRQLVEIVDVKY
ncbi:GreA/GreB family elongation factor [Patescibacteria group bacterium]|nr:GreA/GreB family elongation factor [Patescibacteria group bacterium]MBP7841695.1 GreA/GreB family elongation factor [Patescibacteria group bacterium]